MKTEDVNALKAKWFDLVQQMTVHQKAIAKLQEAANEIERQIAGVSDVGSK